MANGKATLKDSLAVSYKAKHCFTVWSRNHAPRYLPNWLKNLCTYTNLHASIYSSVIHNHQMLEATKKSFSKWTDKQTVVYHTPDYYSVRWRNEVSGHAKTRKEPKRTLLSERSLERLYTVCFQLHDILEKAKLGDDKKISCRAGEVGVGTELGRAQSMLRAVKILCVSCHGGYRLLYICQNPWNDTTKSELHINYGLWVMMMY